MLSARGAMELPLDFFTVKITFFLTLKNNISFFVASWYLSMMSVHKLLFLQAQKGECLQLKELELYFSQASKSY